MHLEQQESPKKLDPSAVRQFLTMNPNFFNEHADVLPRLQIPHETGGAVSLIEKQVSVLRGKCHRLESSLRDLISVARENERLHMRLHRLIQDIVSAESLESLVTVCRESLIENFKADDVRMFLTSMDETCHEDGKAFTREAHKNHYTLSSKDPVFDMFAKNFADGETFCGPLSDEQRALLCTGCETELASAALIPLQYNGAQGILVMGSADASRFTEGKGVMFLNQLGEVLSRRVQSFGIAGDAIEVKANGKKSKGAKPEAKKKAKALLANLEKKESDIKGSTEELANV